MLGEEWRHLASRAVEGEDRQSFVATLRTLAESDESVEVRFRAKKLLAELTASDTSPVRAAPAPGGLRQALEAASASASNEERVAILTAFAKAHRAQGIEEMLALLAHEGDPMVLAAGLALAGAHGARHQVSLLRRFLLHENPRVVAGAVEAAGKLDAEAALPMILSLLVKDDNRVRANVLMVLYQTRRPEVLAYLAQMSAKFEESYRASALWCMGQLQGEDTEEILASMICREQVPELLEKELALIARVGSSRCIPQLARCGQDNPPQSAAVRRTIETLAARLGLAPGEREALTVGATAGAPEGLGQKLRRLTRGIRLPAGLRGAQSGSGPGAGAFPAQGGRGEQGQPEDPALSGGTAVGVAAVAIVLVGFFALFTRADVPAAAVTPPGKARPAPAAPAPAAVAGAAAPTGGQVDVKGQVNLHSGTVVTLTSEYQHYAVTYREDVVPDAVRTGDRIHVRGTYAGWDALHGVVHLHGKTLEVLQ